MGIGTLRRYYQSGDEDKKINAKTTEEVNADGKKKAKKEKGEKVNAILHTQ